MIWAPYNDVTWHIPLGRHHRAGWTQNLLEISQLAWECLEISRKSYDLA